MFSQQHIERHPLELTLTRGATTLTLDILTLPPSTEMASGGVQAVDRSDPQVKRIVYNMYRGILGQYNDKANNMLNSLPRHAVTEDRGISSQIESMM